MCNVLRRSALLILFFVLVLPAGWGQRRPTPTPTPIPEGIVQQVERANQMFRQGQREEAIALYRVALQQAPTYVEGHYRLGVALAEAGRYLEAERAFQAVLELESDHTPARNMLEKYAQEIADAKRPTPTPTPTPTAMPRAATGFVPPATGQPKLTDKEQALVAQLRNLPDPSRQTMLWVLRVGFWIGWAVVLAVSLAIGAVLGLLFWLIGKNRGHTYPWCWMYGTFCACFGIVLVFLPTKVSHIIVGIMVLCALASMFFSWTEFAAIDVDLIQRALNDAAAGAGS
ncbi:tetratricopeptide repeat protein [bacterium]|nr:tetratricopeptide repeat protein [bacterium]